MLETLSGVSPYVNNKNPTNQKKAKPQNPTNPQIQPAPQKSKTNKHPQTKKANLNNYCQLLSKCGRKNEDYADHTDVVVTGTGLKFK